MVEGWSYAFVVYGSTVLSQHWYTVVSRIFCQCKVYKQCYNGGCSCRYNNDTSAYREKVKENIRVCHEQLHNEIDDDPHSIRYSSFSFKLVLIP